MKDINSNNEEERNNFNAQQKREEGNMKGINRSVGFCFQDSFRNLYYGHPRREGRRAFPVALLLLTLVLGMCILPGLAVADDPIEQIKPLLTGEDAEKERPDIGAVVYASVLQMCHSQMDTSPVVFTPDAQQVLRRDSFQYLGFGKPLYSVTHFVQENVQENLYNLGVIMSFTDAAFRHCAVFCEFDYSIEGEQILVKQVAVKQLVLDPPQTLLSIVPADRVPDDLLQTHPTHLDLLQWILVNSLKVDEVPEIPSKQPYYIFAATLDRIDKGAKLQIRVSDDKSGLEGEAGGCMDVDYEGWHVAIVRGEFALETDQEFFIKVIYTPGDDVEPKSREPILIGVYSSDLQPVRGTDPTKPPCTGTSTYAYIESITMQKGREAKISVIMCNAKDLANMDLDWSYDASVLKLINVTKGSLNEKALFDWNEVSPGKLKIAFASARGVTGSGSIAVMKFEVIGNTGDTSTLTGTVTTAGKTDGTEISVGVTPGEFTVGTAAEVPGGYATIKDWGQVHEAFSFSQGKVVSEGGDFFIADKGEDSIIHVFALEGGALTGIIDMGDIPLDDIKEAPESGYQNFAKPIEGHSYVMWSHGKYGKIRIEDIFSPEDYDWIPVTEYKFEWVYQPDGTRSFGEGVTLPPSSLLKSGSYKVEAYPEHAGHL